MLQPVKTSAPLSRDPNVGLKCTDVWEPTVYHLEHAIRIVFHGIRGSTKHSGIRRRDPWFVGSKSVVLYKRSSRSGQMLRKVRHFRSRNVIAQSQTQWPSVPRGSRMLGK